VDPLITPAAAPIKLLTVADPPPKSNLIPPAPLALADCNKKKASNLYTPVSFSVIVRLDSFDSVVVEVLKVGDDMKTDIPVNA
jgi:hypothetical protein